MGTTRIETFERLGGVSRARGSELSQLVDLSLCVARAGQRWRGWMESEMKWTLKKRAKAARERASWEARTTEDTKGRKDAPDETLES